MLALSLRAHLLLAEGTSVLGDMASLALRNIIARMMYRKDPSVCGQCLGESKGSGP